MQHTVEEFCKWNSGSQSSPQGLEFQFLTHLSKQNSSALLAQMCLEFDEKVDWLEVPGDWIENTRSMHYKQHTLKIPKNSHKLICKNTYEKLKLCIEAKLAVTAFLMTLLECDPVISNFICNNSYIF